MAPNDYAAILSSVALLIGAIGGLAVWQGRKEGAKPSPQSEAMRQIEQIVSRGTCSAPALSGDIMTLKQGQADLSRDHVTMQRDIDQIRDVVTRIEDRTKRG